MLTVVLALVAGWIVVPLPMRVPSVLDNGGLLRGVSRGVGESARAQADAAGCRGMYEGAGHPGAPLTVALVPTVRAILMAAQ
jgi:hypothetical protein